MKKKKRISVAAAKQKGRRLQQYVGKRIADLLGVEFGPDCRVASRPMGCNGTDVIIDKALLKKLPFSWETKCMEKWNINKAIEQAKSNVNPKTSWALVMSKNRSDPVLVVDFNYFMDWITQYINKK